MKWMMTPFGLNIAKRNGCDPRELLGLIPHFIVDDRPVREQLSERYFGGWRPMPGFTYNPNDMTLSYPNDPPTRAIAFGEHGNEFVVFFDHEWLMVKQADDTYEISRMD